jgi:hypothetical protein
MEEAAMKHIREREQTGKPARGSFSLFERMLTEQPLRSDTT